MEPATDDLTNGAPSALFARSGAATPTRHTSAATPPTLVVIEDGFRSELVLEATAVPADGRAIEVRFRLAAGADPVAPYARVVRRLNVHEYTCVEPSGVSVRLCFDNAVLQTMFSSAIEGGRRAFSYSLPLSPHRGPLTPPVPLLPRDPLPAFNKQRQVDHARLGRYRNATAMLEELLGANKRADDSSGTAAVDISSAPAHNPLAAVITAERARSTASSTPQQRGWSTEADLRHRCSEQDQVQFEPLRRGLVYPHELTGVAWFSRETSNTSGSAAPVDVRARLVFHVEFAQFTFMTPAGV